MADRLTDAELAEIEKRLTVSRIGRMAIRETDADLVAIRRLLDEVRALRAHVANWETWADNLTPQCCCGNCEP